MATERRGKLYVISAPSGTGKSTVIKRLLILKPELAFSVSATTRKPRPGDIEGVTYHFKTRSEFERMLDNGELLEYNEFAGNYYGTPLAPILDKMDAGIDTVLDIDVNGYRQIKEKLPEAVSIFLTPPSMEELERRLRSRGTDDEEVVRLRLSVAKNELLEKDRYDFTVENDFVENAVNRILLIMDSQEKKIKEVL